MENYIISDMKKQGKSMDYNRNCRVQRRRRSCNEDHSSSGEGKDFR